MRSFPSDELPSSLLGEGISESVQRLFPLHDSHPRVQILLSDSLSLFLSLSFALPHSEENGVPFWKSGAVCRHSEGVL